MAHTPTPWGKRRALRPVDGEYDCGIWAEIEDRPHVIAECYGRVSDTIRPDAEANAAFIVRAVNAHEALVEALNRLERWSTPFIEDTPISAETLWREFPAAIKNARAALALAKEENT